MGMQQQAARSGRLCATRLGMTLAAVLALSVPLGGCFSETYQKGYIVPEGALEQIPIGASQEQVLILLGTPSTVATVSGEAFYYISQRAERTVAFLQQQTGRSAGHRGLFRQESPGGTARQLRHQGRQALRLREPDHADQRTRDQLPVRLLQSLQLQARSAGLIHKRVRARLSTRYGDPPERPQRTLRRSSCHCWFA